MKIIITEEQRKSLNEMIKLDIKVGDTLMGGKFKNKKVVVKTIGKNDKGDITINGKPLLRFRLLKESKSLSIDKILEVFKKWLYKNYDEISFLETSTYDGHPLIKIYYTTDSDAVNHDSWLAGEITDYWNKITGGKIPILPRWKFSGYNAKIVIDTEKFNDEEIIDENTMLGNEILNENNRKLEILDSLLRLKFNGIDDMWADWSNYNCGMGECCDPYSISFILPEKNYFEYIFKIVDSSKYDDDADYPREMMDELPEPCEQYPDIRESRFDTLYMPEETTESIEQFYGHRMRWEKDMLVWFNNKFGLNLRDIYYQ